MNNNTIYLAVTVAFMIGLAIIGIMISRGVKSSEDWMVAGKSLGKIPMAGTYFATIVSATSIMSYMGYYYLNGWARLVECRRNPDDLLPGLYLLCQKGPSE